MGLLDFQRRRREEAAVPGAASIGEVRSMIPVIPLPCQRKLPYPTQGWANDASDEHTNAFVVPATCRPLQYTSP